MATWQKILIGIGAAALLAGLFFGGRCSAPPKVVEVPFEREVTKEVPVEKVVEKIVKETVVVEREVTREVPAEKVVVEKVVTATPGVVSITHAAEAGFPLYESEGGVPDFGTAWTADVAPDELEVLTGGPATIAGVDLPGGVNRGSVIVLLPGREVVNYTITNLITGSNWHGSYRPVANPVAESTWRVLVQDRVAAMQVAPNCTSGLGCARVDVLVIGPGPKIVAQWSVGN